VVCHSGHGAAPLGSQLFDNQLPSRSMASLLLGSISWLTVLAQVGASACWGVGPRPLPKTCCIKVNASTNAFEPTTHF
jgi:hypothetical protein